MATNEQIKKWYLDFKTKLKANGVDIDTLGGRMAVIAIYPGQTETIGNKRYTEDHVNYAFAMTDEHGNYNNPQPKQKKVYLDSNRFINERAKYKEEADKLYNEAANDLAGNNREEAMRLNIEARELLKQAQNVDVRKMQFEREQYSERIDWIKENLAPINPDNDADMEHMRYLYNLAEHGRLCIRVDSLASDDMHVIYVKKNGECGVSLKVGELEKFRIGNNVEELFENEKIYVSTDDMESYFRDAPNAKSVYEKKYNVKFPDEPTDQDYAKAADIVMEAKIDAVNAGEIGDNIVTDVTIMQTETFSVNPEKADADELLNERKFDIEMLRGERSVPGYVDLSTDDSSFISVVNDRVSPEYDNLHNKYIKKQEGPEKKGDAAIEKVQKWFLSMKEQLAKQGCDIDTTEGMLMLQSFKEKDREHLIPQYAMMAMDKKGEYLEPDPRVENADIDAYLEHLGQARTAFDESEDLYKKAAKAIEENKEDAAKQYIEHAERAGEEGEKERIKYNELSNKAYKKHDEWLLNNLKAIDPNNPADWDRMKHLYNSAKEGLLGRYTKEDGGLTQIYLKKDGTCGITTDFSKMNGKKLTLEECENPDRNDIIYNADDWYDVLQHNSALKQAYEQKYDVKLVEKIPKPKKPTAPVPVEKPGTRSWIKRICSFGFAHGDFDRYKDYVKAKEIYDREQREYLRLEKDYIDARKQVDKQMEEVAQRLGQNAYQDATEKIVKLSNNLGKISAARANLTLDEASAETEKINTCLLGHDALMIQMANSDKKGFFSKSDLKNGEYHISEKLKELQATEAANMRNEPKMRFEGGLFNSKLIRDAGNLCKDLFDNAPLRNMALSRLYKSYEGDNADVMIDRFLSESNDYVSLFEKESSVYKEIEQIGRKYAGNDANGDEKKDYFDEGMCMVVGMLQNIDNKAFGSMAVCGLLKDGGFSKLSEKYKESMGSLFENARNNLFTNDGKIDNEKYANALCKLISKCNYNVFQKPEEGLSMYKIAQAALTTKLYDILKTKGYEDRLADDDKALCKSASGITFTYMASDAGEIAVYNLHSYARKKDDDKLRNNQLDILSQYGTIISATVLGQQLKNAYKSKDWAEVAAFASRKEYLSRIEKAKSALVNAPAKVLDDLRNESVMKIFADYVKNDKPITEKIIEEDEISQQNSLAK